MVVSFFRRSLLTIFFLTSLNIFIAPTVNAKPDKESNKEAALQAAAAQQQNTLGEDPGPVYVQIVKRWAEVTHFAQNAAQVSVSKLKIDLSNDPKLKNMVTTEFVTDLEQFFYELFASQETIVNLAKLYAQYFTLEEMQELINFYATPLGQKLVKNNTELMLKSQQIGMMLLKKHEKQYMEVVAKYIKPIQQKNSPAQGKDAPKEEKSQ